MILNIINTLLLKLLLKVTLRDKIVYDKLIYIPTPMFIKETNQGVREGTMDPIFNF